jgi:hypothetical protein
MKTFRIVAKKISAVHYDVYDAGGLLIKQQTPTPFADAAKRLLADGAKPSDQIVCRLHGSTFEVMRNTVGKLVQGSP